MPPVPCICTPSAGTCVSLVTNGNCLDVDLNIAGDPTNSAWPLACNPTTNNGLHCSNTGLWVYPEARACSFNLPNLSVNTSSAPWPGSPTRVGDNSPLAGSITNNSGCYDMHILFSMSMLATFQLTGPYRAVVLWGFGYRINGGSEVLINSSRFTNQLNLTGTVTVEPCPACGDCPSCPAVPTPVVFSYNADDQISDAFGYTVVLPAGSTISFYQVCELYWTAGGAPGNVFVGAAIGMRGIAVAARPCA